MSIKKLVWMMSYIKNLFIFFFKLFEVRKGRVEGFIRKIWSFLVLYLEFCNWNCIELSCFLVSLKESFIYKNIEKYLKFLLNFFDELLKENFVINYSEIF